MHVDPVASSLTYFIYYVNLLTLELSAVTYKPTMLHLIIV